MMVGRWKAAGGNGVDVVDEVIVGRWQWRWRSGSVEMEMRWP